MDPAMTLDLNDELLAEFILESREHLVTIESDLLAIEETGENIDADLINKVFRAAHSIKGASGYFGLTKVKELAHRAETVLEMVRSKKMAPNAEITNLLLAAFDTLREMINRPKESNETDIDELVENLIALASSYLPHEKRSSVREKVMLQPEGGGASVVLSRFDYEQAVECGNCLYAIEFDLIHDVEQRGETVHEVFRRLFAAGLIADCEVDFETVGTLDDPIANRLPLKLVLATIFTPDKIDFLFPHNRDRVKLLVDPSAQRISEAEVEKPAAEIASMHGGRTKPPQSVAEVEKLKTASNGKKSTTYSKMDDSIRVNVATLEVLMNLAGELVLGRNQLRASVAQNNARGLAAADQRINQITSELQDVVMQTRLQPIGNVFGKFPRLVRDLAASLGKEIQLDIQGKDVALDRSIIESLSDPLTHMVRNAVDHGIESPEVRILAGKGRQGSVSIEARHEAGHVVVEIRDDGRGIDPDQVAKVAGNKGLIAAEKLEGMSTKEKMALIFLPGLSTNTEVSDISGRGVGMDVVKTNLDRLGGKVEIVSTPGKGTTFRIKLPLTLAIIPSLIVSVEGERFAIPQINVEEMRHVLPGQGNTRIESVGDAEVLVLRDRLIPLVSFADFLGVLKTYEEPSTGAREIDRRERMADRRAVQGLVASRTREASLPPETRVERTQNDRRKKKNSSEIVVVTTGAYTYGLVVSSFHDTEEIVVKPLGSHLKSLEEYAGATILGDGSVALILDIAGLAAKANLDALAASTQSSAPGDDANAEISTDAHSLVLFRNPPDLLCAVPLDVVTRIERVEAAQVEMIGDRRTMQYQGGLLPLVALSDAATVEPLNEVKELAVIIVRVRGQEIGLIGILPVDVVESTAQIDQTTHRQRGVAGSTIVNGKTALIVDLYELADAGLLNRWAGRQDEQKPDAPKDIEKSILLTEDSDFFRSQIRRFLEEDGYAVLAAPDGEAGWELLLKNLERVAAVVTDIEMPRLDGLGLTRRIRSDQRTAHLPVIALTSLAGEDDVARGKAAGVSDYQTKLDRDRLLERLREYGRVNSSNDEVVSGAIAAA